MIGKLLCNMGIHHALVTPTFAGYIVTCTRSGCQATIVVINGHISSHRSGDGTHVR